MVDLSSFPTSRLTVNTAIVGIAVIFAYVLIAQLVRAILFIVKQEYAFYGVGSEPVASYVHGHAPYVRVLFLALFHERVHLRTCF